MERYSRASHKEPTQVWTTGGYRMNALFQGLGIGSEVAEKGGNANDDVAWLFNNSLVLMFLE
jgi:hypothetical protein